VTARPPRPTVPGLAADVSDAREGSVRAFERIFRALAPAVASYLRWHGVSDVDGMTNEVFAQVHRKLASFSGDEQGFRSWVFTIAHHRMVDDRRRAARRPLVADLVAVEDSAVTGDAEEDAFAVLGDTRVRELLESLSPDQRAVLLLRIVADLPIEDVARTLGKPPGAVKALQHRGLASLRRHLEREGHPV
jgi:RNA polymerase sigma factor (sigma-70 family)